MNASLGSSCLYQQYIKSLRSIGNRYNVQMPAWRQVDNERGTVLVQMPLRLTSENRRSHQPSTAQDSYAAQRQTMKPSRANAL